MASPAHLPGRHQLPSHFWAHAVQDVPPNKWAGVRSVGLMRCVGLSQASRNKHPTVFDITNKLPYRFQYIRRV